MAQKRRKKERQGLRSHTQKLNSYFTPTDKHGDLFHTKILNGKWPNKG